MDTQITHHGDRIIGRGIYLGLPVYLIEGGGCTAANWFAGFVLDFVVETIGFDGCVMQYENCGYWRALWMWLEGSRVERE